MLRSLNPGETISVAIRNCSKEAGEWSQVIYRFATKGADTLNVKDYC